MRWLDWYFDGIHRNSAWVGPAELGPFGRAGSIINAAIGSGLVVWGLVTGVSEQPPGFGLVIFAALFALVALRVVVRAFRGDFDGFVIDPDEPDDDADTGSGRGA